MNSYLGQTPVFGDFPFQILSGDGTSFYELNFKTNGTNGLLVFFNGAVQRPGIDFTCDGNALTFSANVSVGVQIFVYGMGLPKSSLAPSAGSVGTAELDASLEARIAALELPSMTGSITLNGTTNNTVAMANIVTELALEVGDVIRINTGAYNKLHTVESITNNGSIIVNYEHAENRGNGSLKLPNSTGQATVTRIAKWFNASLGLGQAWVNVLNRRSLQTIYKSIENRLMAVFIKNTDGIINIGGEDFNVNWDGVAEFGCIEIPSYSDYSARTSSLTNLYQWKELR